MPFVGVQAKGEQGALGQDLGVAEPDAIDWFAFVAQFQRQMLLADQTLREHFQLLAKHWRREALAPDFMVQAVDHFDAAVLRGQITVGLQASLQRRGIEPFERDGGQALLEQLEVFSSDAATGGHGMPAKTQQYAGMAFGHQVQGVAQMKTGNRAPRALEFVLAPGGLAGGKDEGRPMKAILQARRHDADHALVKARVKDGDGWRRLGAFFEHGLGNAQRLIAHAALDALPFAVDAVQSLCQFERARRLIAEQAFDADRHVAQPTRGIDARRQRKTEIQGRGHGGAPTRHFEQSRHARRQGARADAPEALCDQAAVVGVQLHHVGHRAQGHQGQQAVQARLSLKTEDPARAQFGAQGEQHIEHHADASDGFAREGAARLVRVDDGGGLRQ